MATLKNLKVGQTIYTTHKQKMGNTTISTTVVTQITIKSIDLEKGQVTYNSSRGKSTMGEWRLKQYRISKPVLVSSFTGCQRLATKEEIKKMKEEKELATTTSK